jgi:ABC-type nitrate/sulfonate/bicarbonate transport system substrate-binding protein
MKRRDFTSGAAASALARPAQALGTVTTQFLWIKNVEYAGFYIADADGLFCSRIAPSNATGRTGCRRAFLR